MGERVAWHSQSCLGCHAASSISAQPAGRAQTRIPSAHSALCSFYSTLPGTCLPLNNSCRARIVPPPNWTGQQSSLTCWLEVCPVEEPVTVLARKVVSVLTRPNHLPTTWADKRADAVHLSRSQSIFFSLIIIFQNMPFLSCDAFLSLACESSYNFLSRKSMTSPPM